MREEMGVGESGLATVIREVVRAARPDLVLHRRRGQGGPRLGDRARHPRPRRGRQDPHRHASRASSPRRSSPGTPWSTRAATPPPASRRALDAASRAATTRCSDGDVATLVPLMPNGAELMEQFVKHSPFSALVGLEARVIEPDHVELVRPLREEVVTIGDTVHGGAISHPGSTVAVAADASSLAGAPRPPSARRRRDGRDVRRAGAAARGARTRVAPRRAAAVLRTRVGAPAARRAVATRVTCRRKRPRRRRRSTAQHALPRGAGRAEAPPASARPARSRSAPRSSRCGRARAWRGSPSCATR